MNIVMQLSLASISSIVPECILHPCSLDVLWMKILSNVPAWVHHASSLDVLLMKILSIIPESILPSSLKTLSNVPESILHPAWMYSEWRYFQMFLSTLELTATASWIYRRHPFVLGFDCFGCVHPSLVISLSFIAFTGCNYKRLVFPGNIWLKRKLIIMTLLQCMQWNEHLRHYQYYEVFVIQGVISIKLHGNSQSVRSPSGVSWRIPVCNVTTIYTA